MQYDHRNAIPKLPVEDCRIPKRYFKFVKARHDGSCGVQVLADEAGITFEDAADRLSQLQFWNEASPVVVNWSANFLSAFNRYKGAKGNKKLLLPPSYVTRDARKCCVPIALNRH